MNRLRIASSATISIVLMLAVRESAAAPGPVGPELPAEDRPVPADGWWKSCTDARSVTTTIEADCVDERCEAPTNLYVERTDANGQRLAPRLRPNDGLVLPTYYRVSCDAEGWVVAQWRDAEENCFVHRVLDPDGNLAGAAVRTAPTGYDCRARPSVAVKDDGGFLAVWPAAKLTMTSGIVVQSFDQAGVPATDAAYVTDDAIGWNRQPKIAIDDAGVALVAWLGAPSGATDPVFARFLDAGGAPLSPAMQLSTFEYGTTSAPTVSAEAAGTFLVVWSNPFQGGRVGRRVSLTGGGASTARTEARANPSAKANDRLPRFGIVRTVESDWGTTELYGRDPYLGGDGAGTWLIGTRDGYHLRTADDGLRWADRKSLDAYGRDLAVGIDESGVALALVVNERGDTLFVSRSTDGGATWSERKPVAPVVPDGSSCAGCGAARASVVGDGGGTWIAAWTVTGGGRERIFASRSEDGGKAWGKVRTIDARAGADAGGFALATDDADTWMIVWLDDDLRVTRSIDDGRTWSPSAVIASDAACDDCSPLRHFSRLQMTHDGAGRWVLVFASSRLVPTTYGHDGDVFVSRSSDHGATWTAPAPIAPYATTDGSRENEPAIATDGEGRWLTTWTSYRPLGGADGMDADVVFAISRDAGATWTVPAAALADANSDAAVDWTSQIATDGRGAWMMTWKTWPFPNEGWSYATTYAAVADATCGNAVAEVGEACDDGNDIDGDGCDHDCSETGCGNGIVTEGEECDASARTEEINCLPDCKISRCGDGYYDPSFEQCDDGNAVEDDGCTSSCQLPRCGDGTVQAGAEECDDGNWENYDECTNECSIARCGDGIIQDRVEACDDGQLGVPDNDCPDTCDRATCGDGYTSRGFEECDPSDPRYASACSEDCQLIDLCGDADGDGEVTIIDVQHILGRGVGLDVWCPREPCDMNGDGYVRARDARMGIGKAVGLEVGDRCTLGTGNVIFWIDYTGEIGALQLKIDYLTTGGSFAGSGATVACEALAPTIDDDDEWNDDSIGFASFNDDEHDGVLHVAMVSLDGFSGPLDLFRCAFELPQDRGGMGFTIETIDASDPELAPIFPMPLVGYRME